MKPPTRLDPAFQNPDGSTVLAVHHEYEDRRGARAPMTVPPLRGKDGRPRPPYGREPRRTPGA
jgi:hypothetical protein